jgi:hypothetical protein
MLTPIIFPTDLQTIFDTAVLHLAQQQRPAIDNTGACRYRADGGLKCAIGCFIPDDQYNPGMDGLWDGDTVAEWADTTVITLSRAGAFNIESSLAEQFLAQLQACHDRNAKRRLADLTSDLTNLATQYHLSSALVSTITAWYPVVP